MADKGVVKIKVDNLKKSFGPLEVLKDISVEVHKGEVVCVIGPSGSGKSTFLRCLNRLEKATEGKIVIDDTDITSKETNINKVRENIGMVFQHFNLFNNLNILDNLTLAPVQLKKCSKEEAVRRARQMLEKVGLAEKEESYPSQLSGGQKQRVGIARALASNPKVLLSDEATSALDPQTTKSILQLLRDINKRLNLTIVMITHQMEVVKEICDRVAVIENGVIIEEGTMYKVFTEPQMETTQEFVKTVNDIKIPPIIDTQSMKQSYFPGARLLVNLTLLDSGAGGDEAEKKTGADQPLVSALIKKFGVDVNIISGKVDYLKDTPYGTLLVEIMGDEKGIADSVQYAKDAGVKVEVIGYVG